jgi:hypothetical protein
MSETTKVRIEDKNMQMHENCLRCTQAATNALNIPSDISQSAIGTPPATGALIRVEGTRIRLAVEFRYTMPVPVLGLGFSVPPGVPGGVPDAEPETGLENDGVTGDTNVGVEGDCGTNNNGEGSWSCTDRLLAMAANDEEETEGTGTAGLSP